MAIYECTRKISHIVNESAMFNFSIVLFRFNREEIINVSFIHMNSFDISLISKVIYCSIARNNFQGEK